jgi:hypothetical protein
LKDQGDYGKMNYQAAQWVFDQENFLATNLVERSLPGTARIRIL